MIRLTSRYATAEIQYILDSRSSETRPTVSRFAVFPPSASEVHRWRDGDRVDLLGKKYAAKSSQWWTVMDLNSDVIDPLGFTHGSSVVVR